MKSFLDDKILIGKWYMGTMTGFDCNLEIKTSTKLTIQFGGCFGQDELILLNWKFKSGINNKKRVQYKKVANQIVDNMTSKQLKSQCNTFYLEVRAIPLSATERRKIYLERILHAPLQIKQIYKLLNEIEFSAKTTSYALVPE